MSEAQGKPMESAKRGSWIRGAMLLLLLLVSGALYWTWGADRYRWADPVYVAVNGLALLIAFPTIVMRALRQTFGEGRLTVDLLMSIVMISALCTGLWLEGALVALIALISEALERAAHGQAARIDTLSTRFDAMTVNVKRGEERIPLPLRDLQVGDVIVVSEGESIPVDGEIVFGNAQVSEAAITGESSFNAKAEGDAVFAGSTVQHGFLEIKLLKRGEGTLLAQVEQSVAKARRVRTPTEVMLDRTTALLVPLILAVGLGVFLFGYLLGPEKTPELLREALRRAMTVVVVASPSALALTAPIAVWMGLRRARRRGILFRDGAVMEKLSGLSTLLIDKTGTLTVARPRVAEVKGFGKRTPEQVLQEAVFVEAHSKHPLARTIVEYAQTKVSETDKPDKFIEFEGGGACAIKGERYVKVGAFWLMEDGRDISDEVTEWMTAARDKGYTCVLVADREHLLGGIAFEDEVRTEARDVLARLRKLGVKKMVMLTGDNAKVAHRIAVDLGMNEYVAECMPDTKMRRVQKEQGYGGKGVVMVGDGINDAPALAKADVGIAMGAMGTDLAMAAAQVTLLNDSLEGLYEAFALSRRLVTSVSVNIFIACALGLALTVLAAMGSLNLLQGAVLQQGIALIIAINTALLTR